MPDVTNVELVPYPSIPLEKIYKGHSFFRGLYSRHSIDVFLSAIAIAITCSALIILFFEMTSTPVLSEAVAAALLSGWFAVIAGAYHVSKTRLSTIDVFSSEILARLRVMAAENTVGKIIAEAESQADRARQGGAGEGKKFEPSGEDYFVTFHRRSADLGMLGSAVVDHVTDFYCFHMAARDALRDLAHTLDIVEIPAETVRHRVADVLFMLDLMAFSGLRALDELIEIDAHKQHSRQIALSICTSSSAYLLANLPDDDVRRPEVAIRVETYRRLSFEVRRSVRPGWLRKSVIPAPLRHNRRIYF